MSSRDIDRGIKGVLNDWGGSIKQALSVRVYVECKDCGGKKPIGATTPCPHMGATETEGEDLSIHIKLAEATNALPRDDGLDRIERDVESKGSKLARVIAGDQSPPPTPEELEAQRKKEQNEKIRMYGGLTGKPKRKTDEVSTWGGMSAEELMRAQDQAEGYDVEPQDDDLPKYSMY